jgi:serine/threonine protein kinase
MAVRIENQAEPIPGYRLIERLGGGGFGEVWKCEAPGGLHKAIKFVYGDLKSAGDNGQRAEQELKALSRVKTVRHPYVLSLERYDIIDGQLLIVMELADRNLWDRFKECRAQGLRGIPRDELLNYVEETAEALDLMNGEYGLQHLDIKPQNLFLVHQHVKVADFGLVKDLEGMQASVTGGVTPVYAAPETFDGWVSRFCDQYSLAIVYQELLTGQRPFSGTNVRQLILQHLQAPPNLSPLPPAEQPVIARALAKTPSDRYPTVSELVRALRATSEPAASVFVPSQAPVSRSGPPPAPPTALRLTEADLSEGDPAQTALMRGRQDSGQRTTEVVRAGSAAHQQTPSGEETTSAPPVVHGEGALFPALVLGVGHLGQTVLQQLRETLFEQFGSLDVVPQLRLLLMDTDPEVMRSASRGSLGGALTPNDVLITPLNRPSYYLKPREGREELNRWFNSPMLYRIPRSQVTTGVRALGRLAFWDNYRTIVRRLEAELTACLDPDALAAAARQTGLGVRTNRPRVYIVTSLSGGTGSGTFLDLAYLVRSLLKRRGYEEPDVIGLLLLPGLDGNHSRVLTVGNACAALTELSYYATPGTVFSARYSDREPPIEDSEPPFNRCILLPLPEESDEVATRELAELAGYFLARDLCSPLGRAADLGRAGLSAPPWPSRGLYYQTFGLHRLSWPRRALIRKAARRLCQRLVERWMTKDSKPLREAVQTFVRDQWTERGLGADQFIERLQGECAKALGQVPEDLFATAIDPVVTRCQATAAGGSGLVRRKAPPAADVPPEELIDVLNQLEGLLGKPGDEATSDPTGTLVQTLRKIAEGVANHWGQKLSELPVQLIEEPEFRLAGAEEAVRLLVGSIEQILQTYEPLGRDLAARATEAYERLRVYCTPPRGTRVPPLTAADLAELLRNYPKWRFQCLVLQQVSSAFLSLRGHLSDELREINFCRVRLGELLRILEEGERAEEGPDRSALGMRVFPAGCQDLNQALERFLATITPEALLDLDFTIEALLKKDFVALVHVCLTTANVLKTVEPAMLQAAEGFVATQLTETNAAETFLEQHADAEAEAEIAGFFDEAAPELSPNRISQPVEMSVLAVPPGEAGDHYRQLAGQALPGVELIPAASSDDVVLYREVSNLSLNDLDLLGPQGQEAYRQMTGTENFTPHARIDVDFTSRH